MNKLFLVFIIIFLGVNSVFAYDIVLPKEKKSIVNTKYIFFMGKAKPSEIIKINDQSVYIASNGAFAHSVKLKDGENRIVIRSNYNTQVYKIFKNPSLVTVKPELIEFDPVLYVVKDDNSPLRSSPVDYGINRLSHLFKGTYLLINGEKGNFYRVLLSKNNYAWIDKTRVYKSEEVLAPSFVNTKTSVYKNAAIYNIEFTEKLPYTIEDNNKEIVLKIYNPIVSENSIYTLNIKKPEKYYYKVSLENGLYTLKITDLYQPEIDLQGLVVAIDPGHGGIEKGAIGCLEDMEKDINLLIANELKPILESYGATVVMTRECDATLSLDERIKFAKESNAQLFLSIHLNSIPDIEMNIHKNKGTSVYYYNNNSKDLAEILNNTITKSIGTRNDGVHQASFAVIRPTDYISVLLEIAYMTNPIDSVLYKQENFPSETAKAIADGILKYLHSEK